MATSENKTEFKVDISIKEALQAIRVFQQTAGKSFEDVNDNIKDLKEDTINNFTVMKATLVSLATTITLASKSTTSLVKSFSDIFSWTVKLISPIDYLSKHLNITQETIDKFGKLDKTIAKLDKFTLFSKRMSSQLVSSNKDLVGLSFNLAIASTALFSIASVLQEVDNSFAKVAGSTAFFLGTLTLGASTGITFFTIKLAELSMELGRTLVDSTTKAIENFVKFDKKLFVFNRTIESFNKVLGGTVGTSNEWSSVITRLSNRTGELEQSLQSASSELIATLAPLGFSKEQMQKLLEVAVDYSAQIGGDSVQATIDFIKAINGSSQGVIKYGVKLSESAVQQHLFKEGIDENFSSMSEHEKLFVRYNDLLRQYAPIAGVASGVAETLAGQQKVLENNLIRLSGAFGQGANIIEGNNIITYALNKGLGLLNSTVVSTAGFITALSGRVLLIGGFLLKWAFTLTAVTKGLKVLNFLLALNPVKSAFIKSIPFMNASITSLAVSLGATNASFLTVGAGIKTLGAVFVVQSKRIIAGFLGLETASLSFAVVARTTLVSAFIAIKGAIISFGSALGALLINPVVLVISGIAVALYAVYRAFKVIEEQTGLFSNIWDSLKDSISGVSISFKAFSDVLKYLGDFAINVFNKSIGTLTVGIAEILSLFTHLMSLDLLGIFDQKTKDSFTVATKKLNNLSKGLEQVDYNIAKLNKSKSFQKYALQSTKSIKGFDEEVNESFKKIEETIRLSTTSQSKLLKEQYDKDLDVARSAYAKGMIDKEKFNKTKLGLDKKLSIDLAKLNEQSNKETASNIANLKKQYENFGLNQVEIAKKTRDEQIKIIDDFYIKGLINKKSAVRFKLAEETKYNLALKKLNDEANINIIQSLKDLRIKYKDFGKDKVQIAKETKEAELAVLEELKGVNGINQEELLNLKRKINEKYNQEAIDTNKETNTTIIKATKTRFGQAGSYISTFLSSGAKGLIQSAITAVGDAYFPGLGQALGQLFQMFTMTTEQFRDTLEELFSPQFIKSLSANLSVALRDLPALTEGLVKGTTEAIPQMVIELAKLFGPDFQISISKSVVKGFKEGITNAWKGGVVNDALISELDMQLKTIADKRIDIEKQIADETEKIARDANNNIRNTMLERQTEITNSLKTIASRKKEIEKEMNDISVQEALNAINKKKELATAQFESELELLKQTTAKSTEIYKNAVNDRITKEKEYDDLIKQQANARLSEQEKLLGEQTRDQKAILDLAISDEKAHQSKIDQLKYDALIAKENNDLVLLQSTNDLIDAEQLLYDDALARRLTLEDDYNAQVKLKKDQLGIIEEISLQEKIDNAKELLDFAKQEELDALEKNNQDKQAELLKQSIWEIAQNKTTVQAVLAENKGALGDEETAVKALVQESIKLRNSMTPMIVEATDKSTLLQNELNTITQEATKLEEEAKKMIVPALQEGITKVQELQDELTKLAQEEVEVNVKVKSELDRAKSDKGFKEIAKDLWQNIVDIIVDTPIKPTDTTDKPKGPTDITTTNSQNQIPVKSGSMIKEGKKEDKFVWDDPRTWFAKGGIVPEGYRDDSYPAMLTSGELVIPRNDVTDLRDFLNREKSQTNLNTQNQTQAQNLTVNLNVGEANLAKVLLNLNRQGFRTV